MIGAVVYERIAKKAKAKNVGNRSEERTSEPHGFRVPQAPRRVAAPVSPALDEPSGLHLSDLPAQPQPGESLHGDTPIGRASRLRRLPAEGSCSLSEHHLHPENDTPSDRPEQESMNLHEEGAEERASHFARWRQAIIDTQILERKF